jgi:hypothetical protein
MQENLAGFVEEGLDSSIVTNGSVDVNFRAAFEAVPGYSALIATDSPKFTIVATTQEYMQMAGREMDEIVGKGLFEAFPPSPDQPDFTAQSGLTASFNKIISTKTIDKLPVHRYDVQYRNGFEEKYWQVTNKPVLDRSGNVSHIIHTAEDVTHRVKAQQREDQIKVIKQVYDVFMEAPVAITILIGSEMVVELANAPCLEMWGVGNEVIGKSLPQLLPSVKKKGYDKIIEHVMQTGERYQADEVGIDLIRNGKRQRCYFNLVFQPHYSTDKKKIIGALVFATEVSQNVVYKQELAQKNQSLELAFEIGELGVFNVDLFTNTVTYSPKITQWFGLSRQGIAMDEIFSRIFSEDTSRFLQAIANSINGEDNGRHDITYRVKSPADGKLRYLHSIGQVQIVNGVPATISGIIQDVSDQVIARNALAESEQQIRSIVESAPFPIGVYLGKEMRIMLANKSIMDVWGKGYDVTGRLYSEVLPELENQSIFDQLDLVYTTGVPFHAKNQQVDLVVGGRLQPFYFNYSFTPVYDNTGNVYGVMNTAAEVSDLVIAKRKIEESEKNIRNMVLQAPVAMCILRGASHVIEIANAKMIELWGKQEDEVMFKPLFEALPEVKQQGFEHILHTVFTTGERFTSTERAVKLPRSGKIETAYVTFVYEALREGDGSISAIMAIAIDVTDQVVARQKIEETEERARLAIQSADLGVYEVYFDNDSIICNQRFNEIFGVYNPKARSEFVNAIHPDDRQVRADAYRIAYETGLLDYEARVIHKDGSTHWIRIRGKVVFNEKGEAKKLLGVAQDTSEQKQFSEALEQKVEERTRALAEANLQLQRTNVELNQFAYIASHDLQEPLRKVRTFTELMQKNLGEIPQKAEGFIEKIKHSSERMQNLINDVLKFSLLSKEREKFDKVDMNAVMQNILSDYELLIEQKEATVIAGTLPVVEAIPVQVNQLLSNLFANALKFNSPIRKPVIEIKASQLGQEETAEYKELNADKLHYKIEFKDNGIGFDQEYAEQIFTIFQRLHGRMEYEGTGIGLAMCKKIVQNHHGVIYAISNRDEGAMFTIILPESQLDTPSTFAS